MALEEHLSTQTISNRPESPKTLRISQKGAPEVAPKIATPSDRTGSAAQIALQVARLPVLVLAWDAAGKLIVWNRKAEELSGYTAGELLNGAVSPTEVLGPDFYPHLENCWETVTTDPPAWTQRLRTRDGRQQLVLWSLPVGKFRVPGWRYWVMGLPV